MRCVVVSILLWFPSLAYSQFSESSNQLNIDHLTQSTTLLGGGVAILDLNNDNLDDIYLTGGFGGNDQLMLNIGNGKFYDISDDSNIKSLTEGFYTFGATVGDINNDGCDDLFITTHSKNERNLLLLNDCNGHFTEISIESGIIDKAASTASSFADFNNDGLLDLYVVNYIDEFGFIENDDGEVIGYEHGCAANYLYINNGDLTFTELAATYGVNDNGCGLAINTSDFNSDGYPDIYIANDFGEWVVPNKLFENANGNSFVDVSTSTGADIALYGMGIASGDYDNDDDIDYYVTNIGSNFLLNNNNGVFNDVAQSLNIDNKTSKEGNNTTSWGVVFADFDNNGNDDVFIANGYIPAAPFLNNSLQDDNKIYFKIDDSYIDKSTEYGVNSDFINRGAASVDINNDGALDIVVTSIVKTDNGQGAMNSLIYLNNNASGEWLQVKLKGSTSNKNGFGATVRAFVGGNVILKENLSGGSHASHNSQILHFGLGSADVIDSLVVNWPSGIIDTFYNININQRINIEEGNPTFQKINCESSGYRCYTHNTSGCIDSRAENFDVFAVEDDGSCTYEEVYTSLDKEVSQLKLSVYPTIFSNSIKITHLNSRYIQVTDINGRLLYSMPNPNKRELTIDTHNFKQGLYLIKSINADGSTNTKLTFKPN